LLVFSVDVALESHVVLDNEAGNVLAGFCRTGRDVSSPELGFIIRRTLAFGCRINSDIARTYADAVGVGIRGVDA